ncbi:hypothetical protein NPM20_24485 [Vibrio parahaemolyticus]|nr:hypothetical protein [Vibrio parahaemolyticus]MCQ6507968.1 hypothetical protein [Vibrio parahaemolyticus]
MDIDKAKSATPKIVEQIIQYARHIKVDMFLAEKLRHAQEIQGHIKQ